MGWFKGAGGDKWQMLAYRAWLHKITERLIANLRHFPCVPAGNFLNAIIEYRDQIV